MQVDKITSTDELRILLDSPEFLFRFECVFVVPSISLTVADKDDVIRSLRLHYLIYANKAE